MKTYSLVADWDPRHDYVLGSGDVEGKRTYPGSKVWRNSRMEMIEKEMPTTGADGLASIAIELAAKQSLIANRPVKVREMLEPWPD